MDTIELRVESLAYGGDGIAHDPEGRAVFVRKGCPGDTVQARIVETHKRYSRAEIVDILDPSDHRVEPRCPYFGSCGGCQWQHVGYETQLSSKRQSVADALARIGHLDVDVVGPILPSSRTYGYRNRVELTFEPGPPARLGYVGADDRDLVPVETCDLLPDAWRAVPRSIAGALRYLSGEAGLAVDRVAVRVSTSLDSSEIDLWGPTGSFPRRAVGGTLADATRADIVTRVMVRHDRGPRAVAGVEVLAGRGRWMERVWGFDLAVSAPSFFQVNTSAAEKLVDAVLEALAPSPAEHVVDAFCGVGTFTLPIASRGPHVTAIETSGSALRDLRRNLERAGLVADVAPGDVTRVLERLGPFDKIVLDPPRAGLDEGVVTSLAALGPKRIVYVSCDPATFARDSARLCAGDYQLTGVTPVDLFPQTYHVEVVGVFDRG